MAISKILYIGDCGSGYVGKHLKQALDYIVEEHKTGEGKWVSSLNCQVDSAYEQMRQTKVQFGKTDQRQGYHMIISERYVSIYRLIEKTVYIYHIADTQTEYTKLFS